MHVLEELLVNTRHDGDEREGERAAEPAPAAGYSAQPAGVQGKEARSDLLAFLHTDTH